MAIPRNDTKARRKTTNSQYRRRRKRMKAALATRRLMWLDMRTWLSLLYLVVSSTSTARFDNVTGDLSLSHHLDEGESLAESHYSPKISKKNNTFETIMALPKIHLHRSKFDPVEETEARNEAKESTGAYSHTDTTGRELRTRTIFKRKSSKKSNSKKMFKAKKMSNSNKKGSKRKQKDGRGKAGKKTGKDSSFIIHDLIRDFHSDNAEEATDAMENLMNLDKTAIGPLLGVARSSNCNSLYAGIISYDDRSSFLRLRRRPSIAVMALYAIEAILTGTRTPYLMPTIVGGNGDDELVPEDCDDIVGLAVSIYDQWWDKNARRSIEDLREQTSPLAGSLVSWSPQLLPITYLSQVQGGNRRIQEQTTEAPPPLQNCPSGPLANCREIVVCVCEPRCLPGWDNNLPEYCGTLDLKDFDRGTPFKSATPPQPKIDGPDADSDPDAASFVLEPLLEGGATPYNCIAWALGETDRWIQPPASVYDSTWREVLKDYGYDADSPVNCSGQCPAGFGPKIMMVFGRPNNWIVSFFGVYNDLMLYHAMKQEDDGSWSSKNGYGYLWRNIQDATRFLDSWFDVARIYNDDNIRRSELCFCRAEFLDPTETPSQAPTVVPTEEVSTQAPSSEITRTNSTCESAIALGGEIATLGTTEGAPVTSVCLFNRPALFYSFVGNGGPVRVSTCGDFDDFEANFRVFTEGCDNPNCLSNPDVVGVSSDTPCSRGATLNGRDTWPRQVSTVAGQIYYVAVGGSIGGSIAIKFGVTAIYLETPVNDKCDMAQGPLPTNGVESIGTIVNASFTSNCCRSGCRVVRGVWYFVIGTGASFTVSVQGQGFRAFVSVQEGECNNLSCTRTGTFSEIAWVTVVGKLYYLYVYDFAPVQRGDDPPGPFSIVVTELQ
eukprot:scaffold8690_cov190-Amphora_coffeaeformis.AAC.6